MPERYAFCMHRKGPPTFTGSLPLRLPTPPEKVNEAKGPGKRQKVLCGHCGRCFMGNAAKANHRCLPGLAFTFGKKMPFTSMRLQVQSMWSEARCKNQPQRLSRFRKQHQKILMMEKLVPVCPLFIGIISARCGSGDPRGERQF